jgi:hypothetical protein
VPIPHTKTRLKINRVTSSASTIQVLVLPRHRDERS